MADLVEDDVAPCKSEQRAMEDSICHDSQSKHEGKTTTLSELPRNETGEIQNSEKVLDEEHQSQSYDIGNGLAIIVSPECNLQQGQSSDTRSHGSPTCTGGVPSSSRETVPGHQQTLNSANPLLQCDRQIRSPCRYPDKALEDGYNWRKYGQKLVKGNEFVRSYYRCTHPNCRAKRQVECSQDGQITDTVYIGKHEHVKPQSGAQVTISSELPIRSIEPDAHALAAEEDKSLDGKGPTPRSHKAKSVSSPQPLTTPTKNVSDGSNPQPVQTSLTRDEINHDGDPLSKRRKSDETPLEKSYLEPRFVGEPKVVVQTMSEVDLLQDGYRWRKYGQKLVKGNPNPRSYYRCSSSGCPMKKHVERASHDPKAVITTYEGQHNHDKPPARTVAPNKGGASANPTALEDETRSKSEEKTAVGLDMVVHISAN